MALELSGAKARAALQSLRDGVPPDPEVSRWMTCGLRQPLEEASRSLLRVSTGSYQVSLVAGSNGAGKSHLLSLIQLMAEERHFMVSFTSQDIATGVSLNRPGLVYQAIVRNLRPTRDTSDEPVSGLVREWAQRAIPKVENAKMNMSQFYKLRDAGLLPEFCPKRTTLCLLLYIWATRQGIEESRSLALAALRGDEIPNTALCQAAEALGLDPGRVGWTPSVYKSDFWFGQLKTLVLLAKGSGLSGAVVVLDEIESLLDLKLPSSKRRAYNEMWSLFRNEYGLAATWLVLAYTPDFLVGLERSRLIGKVTHGSDPMVDDGFHKSLADLRKTGEIDLPRRLEQRDAECVVRHVREIYQTASGAPLRLPDPQQTVQRWSKTAGATRELVRMAVDECDRAASARKPPPGLEPASEQALLQLAKRFGKK